MKDFFKSKGFKALLLLACFLVGLMVYAASTEGVSTIPGSVSGTVLTPIQSFFSSVGSGISGFFGGGSAALDAENAQLRDENNKLREQQVELDELRRQNELYQQLLELKERNPHYQFAGGRVISSDPADVFGDFTIGAGSVQGVAAGNAVITPEGLCGVVIEAGPNFAKVRSILNPDSQISAYVSRTREDGITGGSVDLAERGLLKLSQMDRTDTASVGDYIVTYGGLYPAGLLIGEIEETAQETDGLSMYAAVKPFADMSSLSYVFVITSFEDG